VLSISVLIYNLFIKLYEYAIYLIASQNDKAAKWYFGRKNIFQKIEQAITNDEPKAETIWMHCASLGEFEQGRPLLEALRKQKPDSRIVLTFFSPSGYEIRKNYPNADHVFYLPMDTKNNARRFLYLIRPTLVVFVKYEFWYHYFNEIKKLNTRFILISASFRKKQIFFKWYGTLYRRMLGTLTHIFVQDEVSVALLQKSGFQNVTQINDTRIDRVVNIASAAKTLPTIALFLNGSSALVAGSIYETENDMLRRAFQENCYGGKWILVPHNVDQAHISKIREKWGDDAIVYTEFNEKEAAGKNVLIIDTIGLLSNIYKYAEIALVGGGFGKGIHNTLEPAAFGIPVLMGPNYHKFKEAREMISQGASFSFESYDELKNILQKLQEKEFRENAGIKAGEYIFSRTGGTKKVLEWLQQVNA
jgi:3-deoxy-D-manno-octulosonic-acid transferase